MMVILLLESEIKCLLAAKFLQSFAVSNRQTIGLAVKAVKFGVCANRLIISSFCSSTAFTQKICVL